MRGLVIRRARVQAGVVVAAFLLVLGATIALVTVAAFAAATTATAATLVSGTGPALPEGVGDFGVVDKPVPVAVSAADAARYHLAIGARVPLPRANGTFYIGARDDQGVVVGIYRPKSANDPVWAIPASAGGGVEFFLVDPEA